MADIANLWRDAAERRVGDRFAKLPDGNLELRRIDGARIWVRREEARKPPAKILKEIAIAEVSKHLRGGLGVRLELGSPLKFRPKTLLGAVYLDLAMEMTGAIGERIAECAFCHRPFRRSRRDNLYCSHTCCSSAYYPRQRATREDKP